MYDIYAFLRFSDILFPPELLEREVTVQDGIFLSGKAEQEVSEIPTM